MKKFFFGFALVLLLSACGNNCSNGYNPYDPSCTSYGAGYGQQQQYPYNNGYQQTPYGSPYTQSPYGTPAYGTPGYSTPYGQQPPYYGPNCRPGAPGCAYMEQQ